MAISIASRPRRRRQGRDPFVAGFARAAAVMGDGDPVSRRMAPPAMRAASAESAISSGGVQAWPHLIPHRPAAATHQEGFS